MKKNKLNFFAVPKGSKIYSASKKASDEVLIAYGLDPIVWDGYYYKPKDKEKEKINARAVENKGA